MPQVFKINPIKVDTSTSSDKAAAFESMEHRRNASQVPDNIALKKSIEEALSEKYES